jgi:hypothetical protein
LRDTGKIFALRESARRELKVRKRIKLLAKKKTFHYFEEDIASDSYCLSLCSDSFEFEDEIRAIRSSRAGHVEMIGKWTR